MDSLRVLGGGPCRFRRVVPGRPGRRLIVGVVGMGREGVEVGLASEEVCTGRDRDMRGERDIEEGGVGSAVEVVREGREWED